MIFAPWKYRNILESEGGPIAKLTEKRVQSPKGVTQFQALAYLKTGICSELEKQIYGTADGCGTAQYRHLASYKAISESLERWAYKTVVETNKSSKFGFNIDPTTSGMAAFPGLFPRSARTFALFEAIERWAITHWWEKGLPVRKFDENAVEIITPWGIPTVICWDSSQGFWHYGFAAHKNVPHALAKAQTELFRNSEVLSFYYSTEEKPSVSNENEKRLIYFSTAEGFEHFSERIEFALKITNTPTAPRVVTDCEIQGEWSKYAFVWRVLFEPVSSNAFQENPEYFLF